jgi:hypothetical protein
VLVRMVMGRGTSFASRTSTIYEDKRGVLNLRRQEGCGGEQTPPAARPPKKRTSSRGKSDIMRSIISSE